MKNKLIWICLLLVIVYFYRPLILDTKDAVLIAEMYLNNPPEHTYIAPINVNVMELAGEHIQTQLYNQTGMFNQLFNRMQWEVTLQFEYRSSTVVIDAHNGKLIQIIGGLN